MKCNLSDGGLGPSSTGELLARARQRGAQIRRRHLLARAAVGAGGAAVVLVVVFSLTASGSGSQRIQVVAPPTSATITPLVAPSTSATITPATAALRAPATTELPSTPSTAVTDARGSTISVPGQPSTTVTREATATTAALRPPETITVTDTDSGKTLSLPVGTTLIVKLSADNWTVGPATNPAVLRMNGQPTQSPSSCIPGGTCGTTTASFSAEQVGQAQVSASRDYCGEAIRCTPPVDAWSITLQVAS
jgi:hypothetical protein